MKSGVNQSFHCWVYLYNSIPDLGTLIVCKHHWQKTLAPTAQPIPRKYFVGLVLWFQAITYDNLQWETRLWKIISVYTFTLHIWAENGGLLATIHRECPNVIKGARLILYLTPQSPLKNIDKCWGAVPPGKTDTYSVCGAWFSQAQKEPFSL